MRNTILPAKLVKYDGEYATVLLQSWGGDPAADTVEEVIPLSINTRSQTLPEPGEDVLVVWDHAGDVYMLGSFSCDNQPRPDSDTDTHRIANENIRLRITSDGKLEIANDTAELVEVLSDLIQALITATTPTAAGPQPLSVSVDGTLAQLKALIDSFKV